MPLLTADQILAAGKARPLPFEDVECPELGEGATVRIRSLTGREMDEYQASQFDVDGKVVTIRRDNLTARLVALSAVDESGKRLFSTDQAAALGELEAPVLARLCAVAERLSGLDAASREARAKN